MEKKVKIALVVVVAILVVAAVAYNAFNGNSSFASFDNKPVPQAQVSQLYSIANNATLAKKIGFGVIGTYPVKISGSSLMVNGKPTVMFVGADYCPFCAAARWSLVLALMRFGNLTGLQYMTSSATDVAASTPTFTFSNATYSSTAITFLHVETENVTGFPLQTLSPLENTTFYKYDTQGIPFIDFGNKSIQAGADYSPYIINQYSWSQIISQLSNPNSTISQSVIGGANIYTAHICQIDNFTPASVCDAPYVSRILNLS